jgi:hypothetical protein
MPVVAADRKFKKRGREMRSRPHPSRGAGEP